MLSFICLSTMVLHSSSQLDESSHIQPIEHRIEQFNIEQADLASDFNQIADTVNLAYRRQPFNRPNYPRITVDGVKELLQNQENQLFVVVSSNNEICGTVLLHGAEIYMLSVHPRYQKQGLGLSLLQYAEQAAFKTYDSVLLKVIPLFQEKLIRYYESLGYKSFGEHETLSQEKLQRVQEQYHHHPEMFALIMRKDKKA